MKAAICHFFILLFLVENSSAETHEIIVSSNVFSPNSLVIEAGDTVRWINTGGSHNVRASNGSFRCAQGCDAEGGNGSPSSELWSFEVTFRTLGTVPYICEPHIDFGMQGSITVVEPQSVVVHEVYATIENEFVPNDLTIQRGEVVRFINAGGEHNINSVDNSLVCSEGCSGDGTNADNSPTGSDWDIFVKFSDVAEVPYFCATHNNSAIIRVESDGIFKNGFEFAFPFKNTFE
ncbi:MAG: plastocyanin/azurin family copper-binding protein [Marinicellaceae bacterium]